MRPVCFLSGMMVVLVGLDGHTTDLALASTPPFFDALVDFGPNTGQDTDLSQLSDVELSSILGGEASNPLQTLLVMVPEPSRGIVNQNFTYVLTRPGDQSPASNTNETTTNGKDVVVEQTQMSFQTNNPQRITTSPSNQPTKSGQYCRIQRGNGVCLK